MDSKNCMMSSEDLDKSKGAAACVYIEVDGKVLAVSRKDDHTDFGLPGGKVEDDESKVSAASRELKEETGIEIDPEDLQHIYSGMSDISGYTCCIFEGNVDPHDVEIETDEDGVVKWVEHEVLFDGTFGRFNRRLYRHLNRSALTSYWCSCGQYKTVFRDNKSRDISSECIKCNELHYVVVGDRQAVRDKYKNWVVSAKEGVRIEPSEDRTFRVVFDGEVKVGELDRYHSKVYYKKEDAEDALSEMGELKEYFEVSESILCIL